MSRTRKKTRPSQSAQVRPDRVGFDLHILGRWAGPGVILIAGLIMLEMSWRKWLDPIVDFGRELYVPWRLSLGEVLYHDIAYFNGPLSPYFNALLFKTFGVGLMTIAWVNIAILAGLTFLIYHLLRLVGSRLVGVLGCVAFLVIFGLAQFLNTANYNFVCPYSHELVHGFALSLLAIYLLYRYLKSSKVVFLGLAGACLGLILLTKVEVFAAGALALAVGWVLILLREKPSLRRGLRLLAFFAGGMAVPLVCFGVYFALHMPLSQAVRSVFAAYTGLVSSNIANQKFYQGIMGLDAPGENLLLVLKVTGCYLLLLGPLAVVDYLFRRFSAHRKYISPAAFVLSLGLCLWLFEARRWSDMTWLMPKFMPVIFTPLPLFMAILAGIMFLALIRISRDSAKGDRYCLGLLLSVFSLALLFKIVLNIRVYQYGFVLAAPAVLLLIVLLVDSLPRLLAGKSMQGGWFFKSVILAVVIMALAGHFNVSRRIYAHKTHQLGKGPDAFFVAAWPGPNWPKGVALSQTLKNIAAKIGPDETFVVFPEGVMLNYLSRRPNPTKYFSFMPAELALFSEEAMLAALRKNPPDHVLIVSRNLGEYGYRGGFRVDYCLKLSGWISDNYGKLKELGLLRTRDQRVVYGVVYPSRTAKSNLPGP